MTAVTVPQYVDDGYLELVSVIGTGAYGVVYLAVDSRYGQPVYRAVKCLRRTGLDARQRHFQRREIALHRLACAHRSIITMDRLIEEGDYLFVVMDYGEEGDLFAMITDQQRYVGDDELIRDVFLQLLDGVQFLHQLGIAHRDIKPENIVCSNDGQSVYICDFGLATSEVASSEFGCGSTFYIAPECLGEWFPENPTYPTQPGDVWSLGIILVNLVCGRNPWRIASPSDESFNSFLKDPNFLRRILPVSEQCLYILTQIFTVDPAERISLACLRKLILEVDTFTMDEEELRLTHIAAQTQTAPAPAYQVEQEWTNDEVFPFDQETPSLRADSGSPSPDAQFSRSSSSNGGSLPPTPLLSAASAALPPLSHHQQIWDMLKPDCRREELRYSPNSPDPLTSHSPNPFFR
ncbi:Ran1-like protein kinase [Papiliotrema laurentii]|uniref:Ran1-like protein kinase n=1 Tax=Papiliotrema laurentii TaxID=5418 RepID=A0AAD9L8I7_PAPLA|nr:Ran1-like protein kinase [Papiliotrema laurentii]